MVDRCDQSPTPKICPSPDRQFDCRRSPLAFSRQCLSGTCGHFSAVKNDDDAVSLFFQKQCNATNAKTFQVILMYCSGEGGPNGSVMLSTK
jgi:hypothetical protein